MRHNHLSSLFQLICKKNVSAGLLRSLGVFKSSSIYKREGIGNLLSSNLPSFRTYANNKYNSTNSHETTNQYSPTNFRIHENINALLKLSYTSANLRLHSNEMADPELSQSMVDWILITVPSMEASNNGNVDWTALARNFSTVWGFTLSPKAVRKVWNDSL